MRREVNMDTQQRRHGRKAVCSCCSVLVLCNATCVAAGDTLVRTAVVCLGLEAHSDLASSWPTRAQPRKLRLCLDVTAPLPSPAHVFLSSRHLSLPLPMDLLTIFGCFCRPLQWGMVGFESGEC